MSAEHLVARAVTGVGAGASAPATLARAASPALARRLGGRLGKEWLPRAAWSISRTGRPGLVGLALLFGAALFLFATHLQVVAEVEALRADLAIAQGRARAVTAGQVAVASSTLPAALPARADMPAIVRQLYEEATRAQLAVDSARYVATTGSAGVVRYQITFPVTGPYPQIRAFIDGALTKLPAVALSDLSLERKSIADGSVEAQLRLTVYTRSAP
jgi:hypothetical protein